VVKVLSPWLDFRPLYVESLGTLSAASGPRVPTQHRLPRRRMWLQ
jgi:hypothetical protein